MGETKYTKDHEYIRIDGDVVVVGISEDPEGTGWFIKLKLSDASELASLMSEADYKTYLASIH